MDRVVDPITEHTHPSIFPSKFQSALVASWFDKEICIF